MVALFCTEPPEVNSVKSSTRPTMPLSPLSTARSTEMDAVLASSQPAVSSCTSVSWLVLRMSPTSSQNWNVQLLHA